MFTSTRIVSGLMVMVLCGLAAVEACDDKPSGSASGQGGSAGDGGAGGAPCPTGPEPIFTIAITAVDGHVPPDTSIEVMWSAGEEPAILLNEPGTWKTLDQGANVVCDIDENSPPPIDLPKLVCQLWTSGPTEVVIKAHGYQTFSDTLVPDMSEQCEGPIPSAVDIQLLLETDAGPS